MEWCECSVVMCLVIASMCDILEYRSSKLQCRTEDNVGSELLVGVVLNIIIMTAVFLETDSEIKLTVLLGSNLIVLWKTHNSLAD